MWIDGVLSKLIWGFIKIKSQQSNTETETTTPRFVEQSSIDQ